MVVAVWKGLTTDEEFPMNRRDFLKLPLVLPVHATSAHVSTSRGIAKSEGFAVDVAPGRLVGACFGVDKFYADCDPVIYNKKWLPSDSVKIFDRRPRQLYGSEIVDAAQGSMLFVALADPNDPVAWDQARVATRAAKKSGALSLLLVPVPFYRFLVEDILCPIDADDVHTVLWVERIDPFMELTLVTAALGAPFMYKQLHNLDFGDLQATFESARHGTVIYGTGLRERLSLGEVVEGIFSQVESSWGVSSENLAASLLSFDLRPNVSQEDLHNALRVQGRMHGNSASYRLMATGSWANEFAAQEWHQVVLFALWNSEKLPSAAEIQTETRVIEGLDWDIPYFLRKNV